MSLLNPTHEEAVPGAAATIPSAPTRFDLTQIEADVEEMAKLAPDHAAKLQTLVARVQALEAFLGKVGPVVSRVLGILKTLHIV